jgi:hypothetical protein
MRVRQRGSPIQEKRCAEDDYQRVYSLSGLLHATSLPERVTQNPCRHLQYASLTLAEKRNSP